MRCKTGMYCSRTSDPLLADVLLLLHMDGSNGSSTFTDSGPSNRSVTVVGATLQTGIVKYGTAAGDFTGNEQNLGHEVSFGFAALAVSGDVTIEGWMYVTSGTTFNALVSTGTTEIHRLYVFQVSAGGPLTFALRYDSVQQIIHQTEVDTNQWHHYAAVRSSGVWRLYLNGVQSSTSWSDATTLSNAWRMGADGFAAQGFKGYLDEFRITAAARYTASFTPPDAAFPD